MKTGNLNGQGLAELQNYKIQNLSSAPTTNLSKGRFYFNTSDNTLYVYDGTQWVDALSQGIIYSEGDGIDITNATISIDLATGANAGNVALTTTNGLAANAPTASTSTAGLIEIATDTEASTGTSETLAVNPKQLATKVTGNTAITGATKCKITYDSKGLVTSGDDLQASDIPNLSLSKITDVTATASELNIMDGVTVTANDINSVTSKIDLTDLSIDSGSTNYLGYDNTTGKFSAKVDTTVTANSSKLITSGAVNTAINNAISGGMVYKGVWTATGQTDYSSITLPVKAGYMYLVSGSATIDGIEWNTDDYLVINADVNVGGTITDVKKIDNTEGSDIVRLNATQTLTNKTIDADDNTISDLTTSNFKSGVIQTTVRAETFSPSDSAIPTEKATRTAIDNAIAGISISDTNPALTQTGGVCTWAWRHGLGSNTTVEVFDNNTNEKVLFDYEKTSQYDVSIHILSATDLAAGTYKAIAHK